MVPRVEDHFFALVTAGVSHNHFAKKEITSHTKLYPLRAKTVGDRHGVVDGFEPHRAWQLAPSSLLARIQTVPPAAATTSPDLKRISACGVGQNVLRRRVSIPLTALWRYNLKRFTSPTIQSDL
jgi:hypothetical protein